MHSTSPNWNDLVVIGKIREKQMKGRPITANHVCRNDQALYRSAERAFGSWEEALRHAGIDLNESG